jgi:predicted DNA-binding ribbon-helix-helix protein
MPVPGTTKAGWLQPVAKNAALTRRPYRAADDPPSPLVMHTVFVDGRRTSVRLEPVIWEALGIAARRQGVSVHDLVSAIDRGRTTSNLSSSIRVFVVTDLVSRLRASPLPQANLPAPDYAGAPGHLRSRNRPRSVRQSRVG